MTEIAKIIDETIAFDLAKRCKADGFKKHARTFVRGTNPAHIINVQASRWNFDTAGKFTINVGVFYPAVARRLGTELKGNYPKEYESTLRTRIGSLRPDRLDHWWEVNEHSDLAAIARDVGEAYETLAKPWLETMSTLENVSSALADDSDIMNAAAVALELGRPDAASTVLARGYESANEYSRPTILRFAQRNHLPSPEPSSNSA